MISGRNVPGLAFALAAAATLGLAAGGAAGQSSSLFKQAQAEVAGQGAAVPKVSAETSATHEVPSVPSLITAPRPKPRAFVKEQLITVVIREQASHSSSGNLATDRDASVEASVEEAVRLHLGTNGIIRPLKFPHGKPAIKAEAERTFDGGGSASRRDTLTARITGKIIDIKPNGNLVVEASKKITTEEESYTITVTGVCRTGDVTADNTILSTQMSELEITKASTGAIKDATRRSWAHRMFDWFNLF